MIDNVKLIAMEEARGESLMMGWSIFWTDSMLVSLVIHWEWAVPILLEHVGKYSSAVQAQGSMLFFGILSIWLLWFSVSPEGQAGAQYSTMGRT